MAAYHLARAGTRVLVIDRAKLPREKLCSGGLTWKSAVQLAGIIDVESITIGKSRELWLGVHGRGTLGTYTPELRFVSRQRMDFALVSAAADQGADVLDGAKVQAVDPLAGSVTLADGRKLTARVVIGADGANGVARQAVDALPARRGFAVEVRLPDPRGDGERPSIIDFGLRQGYLWAFPKFDGTVAIGGGTGLRSLPTITDTVRAFALRELGMALPDRIPGHPLPHRMAKRVQYGMVLLLGDAAGLCDPMDGEGIGYALWSGRLAADTALRHLHDGQPLDTYEHLLRKEISSFMRGPRALSVFAIAVPATFFVLLHSEAMRQTIWSYLVARVPPTLAGSTSHASTSVASSGGR